MNFSRLCIGTTFLVFSSVVPADVFVVTNDSGIVIPGSFRNEIQLANSNPGLDVIEFDLPPASDKIISLLDPVTVTDPVIIDGSTQTGFSGTPLVQLVAPPAPNPAGLFVIQFSPGSDGSIISDLSFTAPEETNVSDATTALIALRSDFNAVYNCRIGVDFVPTVPPENAVIVSNLGNIVTHCIIGECRVGIALGLADGAWLYDNAIGTDFTGTQDYGCLTAGISVTRSVDVLIGALDAELGNIIANNGDHAIMTGNPPLADTYSDTSIRKNRIYNHSDLPVRIGIVSASHLPNDSGDQDFVSQTGPQNSAELVFAGRGDGQYTIIGVVATTPNTPLNIDFFSNETMAPLLYGEGQYYLGSAAVTSDATGFAVFSVSVPDTAAPPGAKWISALTSRAVGGATSQFSPTIEATDMISYKEATPDQDAAWIPSGLDSGPEYLLDPGSPDDVDVAKVPGALEVTVQPSVGRYRIAGWHHPSVASIPATSPNLDMYIGKFYVTTTNPPGAALNTVPNFRIRLENEGAVVASATFQYAATGEGGTPHEPDYNTTNFPNRELFAGASLRPASNPAKPSLYRVQFIPIAVPSALNSNIGATFESYATPNPANGTLSLTEVTIAKYPLGVIAPIAEPIFTYSTDSDYIASFEPASTHAQMLPGTFNAEADFQPGRRQVIDLPAEVGPAEMAQVFETPTDGSIVDTLQTPTDKFGFGLLNIISNDPQQAPRVEPGKTYIAEFAASSDMPTTTDADGNPTQGGILFELQTGLGAVVHRLELTGAVSAEAALTNSGQISVETLPGLGCVNPVTYGFTQPGEAGGLYYVCMPTPLDPDIRADTGGDLGAFAAQPGPGENLTSALDISLAVIGAELPEQLRFSPTLVQPFAPSNRARVRLLGVTLYEMPLINDGGYAY